VPTGARRDAQPLDDSERLVTLEAPDYATERTGQPPNVVVEGEIFFSWRSRRGHGVNDTTVSMATAIHDPRQTAPENYAATRRPLIADRW